MKEPTDEPVSQVMASLGRKGGPARADALSPQRRSAIAKAAARKRWGNKPKRAKKAGK